MLKRIAICAGGDSPEAEISIKGAKQFVEWLDKKLFEPVIVNIKGTDWKTFAADGKEISIDKDDFSYRIDGKKYLFDYALINIHGTPGENGLLQSYFDLMHIPYNTCGVLSSALTFNKFVCKTYLSVFGIKSAKGILIRKYDLINENEIIEKAGLPCFIKPNNSGSSCGVTKVKEKKDLKAALENAFAEDNEILIEEFLQGTEITNGVGRIGDEKIVFPITEIVSKNEFFDYQAKYTSGKSEEITPARISKEVEEKCKILSSRIYDLLDCRGIVRIDYIIKDNELFMLEVNTTPGMSQASIIPQQIRAMGMTVTEVYSKIILTVLGK
jgi:D-alanine-D-alanine ligase